MAYVSIFNAVIYVACFKGFYSYVNAWYIDLTQQTYCIWEK